MHKELIREVKFGKATARIRVSMFTNEKRSDGIVFGEEVLTVEEIEIIAGGKAATKDSYASVIKDDFMHGHLFEDGKRDPNIEHSQVGVATTPGAETANEINQNIEEMKQELSTHFEVEEVEEEISDIEVAQEIIDAAKKEGLDKLMTVEKIKEWKKGYIDLVNEGGEGYIPQKVSKEDYDWAINILSGFDIKNNIKQLFSSSATNYRISKDTGIAQTTLGRFTRKESDIGNMSLNNAIKLNDYYLKYFVKTLD